MPGDYLCYLISPVGSNRGYIGCTNNFPRRIRQHNREITGGAKRTGRFSNWQPIVHVTGFRTQREALQFEWAWQKIKPRGYVVPKCLIKLQHLLKKRNWTRSAPLAVDVPLGVWFLTREWVFTTPIEHITIHRWVEAVVEVQVPTEVGEVANGEEVAEVANGEEVGEVEVVENSAGPGVLVEV